MEIATSSKDYHDSYEYWPEELHRFTDIYMLLFSNGFLHTYGLDRKGKKRQIAHKDILSFYGYDKKDLPPRRSLFEQAPNICDRVIRSYLNKDGIPLAGIQKLEQEIETKVSLGDETNWNNLVQTYRDSYKFYLQNEADSTGASLQDIEHSVYRSHKHLVANRNQQ